jgi:hypothetical protein
LRPADEFLAPFGDPPDRPPEPARCPQHQHPLGIEKVFHAEPAADIRRSHLDALGRQPEYRLGELVADAVDALSGQQQVEAVGGPLIAAERRPRLDRRRHETVVGEFDLDDMGRAGKSRRGSVLVSSLKPETEVSRSFVPDRRCVGPQRRGGIDDRIERPVLDGDPLGRATSQVTRFGDNQRYRIADMAHPPARQCKTWRHDHRTDRSDLGDARQRTKAVGAQVGFGEHPKDAAAVARCRGVNPLDCRVGMRRAQHVSMDLPGQCEIVDVPATPSQKPEILEAADRAPAIVVLICASLPANAFANTADRMEFTGQTTIAARLNQHCRPVCRRMTMSLATTATGTRRSALRHLPVLAATLAGVAVVLLALGPIGWRVGWWHFRFAFQTLMPWAAYFGIVALIVAALALVLGRSRIEWRGVAVAIAAFVVGLLIAYVPWHYDRIRQTVPPIHDITTDPDNPPSFSAVVAVRTAEGGNPVAYEGSKIADQQHRAYPDIAPLGSVA